MTKKTSRFIGSGMLVLALAFVAYALNHPNASFPIPLQALYILYALYLIVMVVMLIAPFRKGEIEK